MSEPMSDDRKPEDLSDEDLADATGGATGHRRWEPVRLTNRVGKSTGEEDTSQFASSAGGSPNL